VTHVPPFLSELRDEDARWLYGAGEWRRVRAGEEIVAAGVPVRHLFVMVEGKLVVSGPPGGAVRAATDGLLLCLPREEVDAKVAGDPEFGTRLSKAISRHIDPRAGKAVEARDPGPVVGFHIPDVIERMLEGDI
jgi:hypothetical protein